MRLRTFHGGALGECLCVLAVGAVVSLAAACGSSGGAASTKAGGKSSSTSTGATAGATSTASGQVTTAKAELAKYAGPVTNYPSITPLSGVTALKGKHVWYVPIGAAPPSLSAIGTGIGQALSKAGITMHMCDGRFLPTTIASCLSQAQTQGADAVIAGYVDYALTPTSFDNLVAHHIPVLLAGATPVAAKSPSPHLAFYDTTATLELVQKLQMDAVIADSNAKARVLYIGVSDSPQLKGAAAYGHTYLADHCSGCSSTLSYINSASISKLPAQVSAALIAHPDTTYVVSEVDANAAPIITGIQSAGFTNKVKLAAAEGDLAALQRIKSGNLQFVDPGFSTIYLGWQFADGILRMLTGHTPIVSAGVFRLFSSTNVANLTLTPAAYATIDWYGAKNFEKTFLAAWKIG